MKLDLCGQIVGLLFCSVEDETNCMTGRALGFLTFLGLLSRGLYLIPVGAFLVQGYCFS